MWRLHRTNTTVIKQKFLSLVIRVDKQQSHVQFFENDCQKIIIEVDIILVFLGDVLVHCVVDAVLGALGLPDMGEIFPDNDSKWKGAASSVFIKRSLQLLYFFFLIS